MRRRVAVLSAAAVAAAAALPAAFAVTADSATPATYLVGGDVESINPTQDMLANNDFFLGGYGFSSGRPGNVVNVPGASDALGNRYATGILGDKSYGCDPTRFPDKTCESDGSHVRAFAVSGGGHTIVMGQIETQGYFNAYKQGPFGINEIRKDASAKIAELATAPATLANGKTAPGKRVGQVSAPVPTPTEIVVDSVHSHGGPDTAGVWGGVPTSYLKEVHDQTVAAIVKAWQAMQPATLSYAAVHGGVNGEAQYPPQECLDNNDPGCTNTPTADWLLNNQFREDPANQTMDDEVRVLQAKDPSTGTVLDTYVSFSAHPTVLGSDNRKVTGDYVGRLDVQIEKTFGGAFAMDQVATLGRTQPTDRGCKDSSVPSDADSQNLCALDEYAARVLAKVKEAADRAQPLTGDPVVAMNSYFLNDPTTSPVLAGIVYAGQVIGAPAARAGNAPWYTGTLLGTSVFAGRIGNILIAGGPGEMYPQIVQTVRETVNAVTPGKIQGEINIGTAGDFLGYIIAPLEAYPCPAEASLFSGTCNLSTDTNPSSVGPDPIGNDNYFFNISHTFGERLTCDLLRGAGDILTGDKSTYWSQSPNGRCPAFINDYELAPGTDMQFPEQPDLSSVLTHM
ncbi:MAG TPA: hypothetical protein VFH66_02640 [Mycobacteriales bacterium]|nr:hypothetical protein [Mycobacteriales bacterium]